MFLVHSLAKDEFINNWNLEYVKGIDQPKGFVLLREKTFTLPRSVARQERPLIINEIEVLANAVDSEERSLHRILKKKKIKSYLYVP